MTDNNNSKQKKIRDFLRQSISTLLIGDLADYCFSRTWQNSEHLENYFTDYFNELTGEEFVYYNDAIEYLSQNDISLQSSIEIAVELGYDLKSIDSCMLANLLHQNEQRDQLCNINFNELFNLINQ